MFPVPKFMAKLEPLIARGFSKQQEHVPHQTGALRT